MDLRRLGGMFRNHGESRRDAQAPSIFTAAALARPVVGHERNHFE